MKNKKFKPQLAPNDQPDLDNIQYPILVSYKLDGIRCLFIKGEMLSRSLKPIVNKQLREKFQPLIEYSKEKDLILDGEIYSPELTFQEITRYVMTQDFEDKKSIKKHGKVLTIPEHLKFYAFDIIENDNFEMKFYKRQEKLLSTSLFFEEILTKLKHREIHSKEILEEEFENALSDGFEGLILREKNGRYKCGRGTIKEGLIYKYKPFVTIDSKIVDVIQATKVNPKAEKTTNELGRSVTSKKKEDRIFIEKACAFLVNYKGKELKVVIAMADKEKEEIWRNKEKYVGKFLEYKFMEIGMKKDGLPRHPTSIRVRYDKE